VDHISFDNTSQKRNQGTMAVISANAEHAPKELNLPWDSFSFTIETQWMAKSAFKHSIHI
jgi:hypothetical protein